VKKALELNACAYYYANVTGERINMVLLEFSIAPLEKGESVSPYVARCVDIIDKSGLDYRLHAMGTLVEGNIDEVLALLKKCFNELANDCERITCSAKLDYRKGHAGRLAAKVESVEELLGKKLKTIE
jgi:uncharacterized protein (TIGR00106 family)